MKNIQQLLPVILFIIFSMLAQLACAQSLQGQALIDSLLKELPKVKDDTSKVKTLYKLAAAFAPNDSAAALSYADKCMNISKQIKWTKGIGLAYFAFAQAYYEISDYTTSLQNGQRAYDIFRSIDHKNNMGSSCLMIAKDYRELGYYTKAIENDLAALRLFEKINDKDGIKTCYTNLGNSYYYISDFDKAIENYNKALTANKELNDQYGIASDLDNMANVFLDEGKYDSANVYNLQAIKIFEEIDDQPELSRAYFNRANVLMKLYDAKSAYEYYMRAAEIDKRLGIKMELLHDCGGIGELFLAVAKDTTVKYNISPLFETDKKSLLKKAQYYFKQSLSAENTGDIHLLMYYSDLASETEERLGNYKTALAFHKDYMLYKDSIFNDENRKKLAALETERLAEVKDKEIALLNKDKALQASEIKRQTLFKNIILIAVGAAILLVSLFVWAYNRRKKSAFDKCVMETEMKALRAQMNPHFIFNSLHSINKYILENDKENASAYLSKFSKLMRLILENSREQHVLLEQDLQALELYMQLETLRFQNRFQYSIEIDDAVDKTNTLVPPLLLQPFVENSIVHGIQQKEDGFIKIKINIEDDMIRCIVEDNGVGRSDAVIAGQPKQKNRKSLGLRITQERLDILNRLKKVKTAITFSDVKDADNKIDGFRVELLLPLQLAF